MERFFNYKEPTQTNPYPTSSGTTLIMRANDLPQEGGHQMDVMPLGFEAMELERIKKIFEQAPQGERRYALAGPANGGRFDVLLVNYDNPAALREKDALLGKTPGLPIVAVSRGVLGEAPAYHLRGMLIAAKVFGLLDKIPLPAPQAPPPPSPAAAPPAPATPATEPARAGGYRALVVDDSVAIQKSLEVNLAVLEQIGAIDFADNGEDALEKARAMKYDLIFLDVMMPGIDGYETCSQLRKMPQYKKTPIIMVSGKSSPLDEVKGVIAGCTTYLTKPVQQEAFQKLSRRVLAWLENYKPSDKAAT
jgi:CheY-like chemotaxis protein